MSWRRQLPAYSPLPLRAVAAGAVGLLRGANAERLAISTALSRTFDARAVVLTDSGTHALALAIQACTIDAGGAVALPAYGCYDLATAADGARAKVRLYDLDPDTLAPDPASLTRALEAGVKAVVLVHLYGVPVDPEPVRALAARFGALLIEDAAQGAGASFGARPLGALGDLSVLSFGRGKGNTAGRGGVLLVVSDKAAALMSGTRAQPLPFARGMTELLGLAAQWLLGRPSVYAIPAALPFLRLGETIYHPASAARGLSDVAAGTLAITWPLGEREADVRRAQAARLLARLRPGLAAIPIAAGATPGYLRLPVLASAPARAAAGTEEARRLGVGVGYPQALCDLAGFDRVMNGGEPFPGARTLAQRLVTLPVHGLLSDADLAALETWIGTIRE